MSVSSSNETATASIVHFGAMSLDPKRLWSDPRKNYSARKESRVSGILSNIHHPRQSIFRRKVNPPPGVRILVDPKKRVAYRKLLSSQRRDQRKNQRVTIKYRLSDLQQGKDAGTGSATITYGGSIHTGAPNTYNRQQQNRFAQHRLDNSPVEERITWTGGSFGFMWALRKLVHQKGVGGRVKHLSLVRKDPRTNETHLVADRLPGNLKRAAMDWARKTFRGKVLERSGYKVYEPRDIEVVESSDTEDAMKVKVDGNVESILFVQK